MTVSPLLIGAVLCGCLVVLGALIGLTLTRANHHQHPEPESGPFRPALLVDIEAARVASWSADEQAWDAELTVPGAQPFDQNADGA